MNISIIKQKINNISLNKIDEIDYCCDEMKLSEILKPTEINGHVVVTIETSGDESTYNLTTYYPIRFCPFCGQPITTKIIGIEDCSEEYNSLADYRENLWALRGESDNPSEKNHLDERIARVDKKMKKMFDLNSYMGLEEE